MSKNDHSRGVSPSYDSIDRIEVRAALLKQYKVFQDESLIHTFRRPYFHILDEKIKQQYCGIRALFARRMADYALSLSNKSPFTKEEKSFFYEQLPFILEVVISIQYYHNQILDGKGGITPEHPERIKANLINGNLLERELFNYVDNQVDERWRSKTARMLRRIFQLVDIGQEIEQRYNLFEHFRNGQFTQHAFEKRAFELGFINPEQIEELACMAVECHGIPQVHKPFLYRYFERINLVSSALFKNTTNLIFQDLGIAEPVTRHANLFADYFGMMMQVVNDVTDCSLVENSKCTSGKTPRDAFSDLKNRNVTFPLLLHFLLMPKGHIAHYLIADAANFKEQPINGYYREMIEAHSQYKAIELGRALRDKAMTYIPDSTSSYDKLKDICSIADINRYYYCLKQHPEYKDYKKKKRKFRNSRKNKCHEWQQQQ